MKAIFLLVAFVVLHSSALAEMRTQLLPATGPQPVVITPQSRKIALYGESHALLISVSEYLGPARGGWSKLPKTHAELDLVAKELRAHGFSVERVYDPSGSQLHEVFRSFIARRGHIKNARFLVFFSGHGYTNPKNDFGYLVPADAKTPDIDVTGFYAKAMPIQQLELWAKEIEAKHALFLFDSCFSGSIFTKALDARPAVALSLERWRYFVSQTDVQVRQFISAGSASQLLPAKSEFIPMFVQALQHGLPQQSDGFLTGKEFGLWAEQRMPGLTGGAQEPQSGVIRVPTLSQGDMVFQIPMYEHPEVDLPNPKQASVEKDAATAERTASKTVGLEVPDTTIAGTRTKDGLEWQWPTKGRIVSSVVLFNASNNRGVKVENIELTPIVAAADGKVAYSGEMKGYGNVIIVHHRYNYSSLYAYNKNLLAKVGDSVKGGDKIAEMGAYDKMHTGLHFEIWKTGKAVDPEKYLPSKYAHLLEE